MAGKSVSKSPDVTCKHQHLLIPLLFLCVFLTLMDCMHALNSLQPLNGLRIDLVPIDSLFSLNITFTERLKRAVQRSKGRHQRLQNMSAVTHKWRGDDQMNEIETPVSAGSEEFLMMLAIGTPVLSFSAILDTGSDLIWTQCKPCTKCYKQPTPIYDPSSSSTYSKVPCNSSLCNGFSCSNAECNYHYGYADKSFTKGFLSYETFTLSSQSIPHIAFGCGNDNEGNGLQGGGLAGFGRGPLSLVSQLGPLVGNKFSYCLVSVTDSPSKTSPLFIGQMASLSGSNVRSTPIITSSLNPSYYYLSLEGISVDGQSLNIPAGMFDLQSDGSGGLFIDSGTTYTFLPPTAFDLLKEALNSSINLPQADGSSVNLDLCFNPQGSSNPSFPAVTFHFKGADYDLHTENYLLTVRSDLICLSILPNTDESDISIIGNIQQQNYQILYDNEKNVLSFAPTYCDTL